MSYRGASAERFRQLIRDGVVRCDRSFGCDWFLGVHDPLCEWDQVVRWVYAVERRSEGILGSEPD